MTVFSLDTTRWATEQFGQCQLGDQRRTRRAVHFAAQVAADPSGSTPVQTEAWSDCKAAYRLFSNEQVTFRALAEPHWVATRAVRKGKWLLISDTTEVEFGSHRKIEGLGPTGDGGGRGFLLHSSLMVSAAGDEIVGLAGQVIRYRKASGKEQSGWQRLRRKDRESIVWGQVIDMIGPPPEGVEFIHVFDRGGDHFENYCHMAQTRTGWVVRAAQHRRRILTPAGDSVQLVEHLDSLSVSGSYELDVPSNRERLARTATLEVRFTKLCVPRPTHVSAWTKQTGIITIEMWCVDVREVNPPKDEQPLHWTLLTSEPVSSFEDSWTIISHYEQRPTVEEFHKALKTGCRVEQRFYEMADRLEAVTGLLSVVAVRLLQLKTVARHEPERPAMDMVPPKWIQMLQKLRRATIGARWTTREFFRELAKLGGFLARRHDGEPGWITVWRGFDKLQLLVRGADAYREKCG